MVEVTAEITDDASDPSLTDSARGPGPPGPAALAARAGGPAASRDRDSTELSGLSRAPASFIIMTLSRANDT